MSRQFSEHCSLLRDVITVVGSMTTPQAAKIISSFPHADADRDLDFLQANYIIERQDKDYSRLYHSNITDHAGIDCLWAFLDLISDETGIPDQFSLTQLMEGANVIEFSFIYDTKAIVNAIYLKEGDNVKISAIKQRHYDLFKANQDGAEKSNTIYLFVTESPQMVKAVSDAKLDFSYKIALLEGDITNNPNISYLK